MTLKLFPSEKRSHHRKLFTLIGTLLASVSAGRLHARSTLSWQAPFSQWPHFRHTPKQLNRLHNTIPNKCRNYNFKYVSICNHLCSVHRKTFLSKDVSVSNYVQHILLRSHHLGKHRPGATAIFVRERQFSQTPINVLRFLFVPMCNIDSKHLQDSWLIVTSRRNSVEQTTNILIKFPQFHCHQIPHLQTFQKPI